MESPNGTGVLLRPALPFVLFALLTLGCFWRFVFFGWTLYDVRSLEVQLGGVATGVGVDRGDTVFTLPTLHRLYSDGLHHGELRLWNPYLFCGGPVYDSQTLHPFYPPNLLLHGLLPPRIAYDLGLLLHFFFSGVAFYALLRGMGRSPPAATVGGLLWMLWGYNSLWFSTGTFSGASVFAPLALLGIHRGLEGRGLGPFALGGGALGIAILGTHGQLALHLMVFFSIWLGIAWARSAGERPRLLRGGVLFVAVSLGVGMAAILTQVDSIRNGFRIPGADADLHYSSPWVLVTHIADLVAGKVHRPGDSLIRSEFTIYAGALGTTLAILGAIRGRRDPWRLYLTVFAGSAILVAFIRPLALLALRIPFLNLSMPARWLHVLGFCLSILAAAGLDAVREDPRNAGRLLLGVASALFLPIVLGSGKGGWAETLGGLALALGWAASLRRFPRLAQTLLLGALLVDLLPEYVRVNRHAPPGPLEETLDAVRTARDREREPWRATGSLRRPEALPATDTGWNVALGNNLLALYGVEAVMGYESIAPRVVARYCRETSGAGSVMGSGRALAVFDLNSRLLDLANMKYVFMPFPSDPEARMSAVGTWGPLVLYENRSALPRGFLVSGRVYVTGEDQAAALLRAPGFDPRTTVILQTPEAPLPDDLPEGKVAGSVAWISRRSDRIELEVTSGRKALLVVSETDYPGWRAEVDGQPTPILRADLAFRAIEVPEGTHRVTMRFRPASAWVGLLVTSLSLAILLAPFIRRKPSS